MQYCTMYMETEYLILIILMLINVLQDLGYGRRVEKMANTFQLLLPEREKGSEQRCQQWHFLLVTRWVPG